MLLVWCRETTRYGVEVDGIGGFDLSLDINSGFVGTSGKVEVLPGSNLGGFGT